VTPALSSLLAAGNQSIGSATWEVGGNFNFYFATFLTQNHNLMARSGIGQPHVLQSSLPIQTTKSSTTRAASPRSVRLCAADSGPKFCNGMRMGARAVGGKEKDWPPGFEQQQLLQNR